MAAEDSLPAASFTLQDLHPELAIAAELLACGTHQEAVRKAAERFLNRVGEEAKREHLHGTRLLGQVFSDQQPLLLLGAGLTTPSEQSFHRGYRHLALGLAEAVRNVYTHDDEVAVTEVEALEWLGFISAMHRLLDRAEHVAERGG